MKKLLFLLLTLTPILGLAQRLSLPFEDWDFTPQEYQALLQQNRDLYLTPESLWLPEPFQQNLLETLKFALSRSREELITDGVNAKDLYHGHIACRGLEGVHRQEIKRAVQRAHRAYHDLFGKVPEGVILPIGYPGPKELREQRSRSDAIYGNLLEKILANGWCEDLIVVYHTYEWKKPSHFELDSSGDPRRNIITDLTDFIPRGFRPPDTAVAGSWKELHQEIIPVGFLVDVKGGIHVTYGSLRQLGALAPKI